MINYLKKHHKDIIICSCVSSFALITAYIFLGFSKYGLGIPYCYGGGDDVGELYGTKVTVENPWFWFNDRSGAPFGTNNLDFSSNLLINFDRLLIKVFSLFCSNVIVIFNLRFLVIFPICAANAYYVLRKLNIKPVFSVFGALAFSFAPYIFFRNIPHLVLSSCYFIPFSVLICVWAFEDDERYLRFDRNFFKYKKNDLTLLFAILIANNGIGYYAFFTCFFLCVTAVIRVLKGRKLRDAAASVKTIGIILLFFIAALAPHFIYDLCEGGNPNAYYRSLADGELYGLKITQLFLPLNGHGIEPLENIISDYNSEMPLVNENASAYLGIPAALGFLISLVLLLIKQKDDKPNRLFLLSRLNVFAVLYAVIGGFSSIIFLAVKAIRGFNRISVFIMFISLIILCECMQLLYESKIKRIGGYKKNVIAGMSFAVMVLSVGEQLPEYGSHDNAFEVYDSEFNSDKAFVESIEDLMEEGASIYQLPYHPYPESGPVNNMQDYHLFVGYIYSDRLNWSYGGVKGRSGDIWNRNVSSLPVRDMLTVIAKAGFSGLYIDARAYSPERLMSLQNDIESVLDHGVTLVSNNGNLIFYDLRKFISDSRISYDDSVLDEYATNEVMYFSRDTLFYTNTVVTDDGKTVLAAGGIQYGPYIPLETGEYLVTVSGEGLEDVSYDAVYNSGEKTCDIKEIEKNDNELTYIISLNENASNVEFRIFNNTDHDVISSLLKVEKVN